MNFIWLIFSGGFSFIGYTILYVTTFCYLLAILFYFWTVILLLVYLFLDGCFVRLGELKLQKNSYIKQDDKVKCIRKYGKPQQPYSKKITCIWIKKNSHAIMFHHLLNYCMTIIHNKGRKENTKHKLKEKGNIKEAKSVMSIHISKTIFCISSTLMTRIHKKRARVFKWNLHKQVNKIKSTTENQSNQNSSN